MEQWKPFLSALVFLAVFFGTYGVGIWMFLRTFGNRKRALHRLRNLTENAPAPATESWFDRLTRTNLPKIGNLLFPKEGHLAALRKQMVQAGFYRPKDAEIFLGAKLALMIMLPALAAIVPFIFKSMSLTLTTTIIMSAATAGILIPNYWLDRQVKNRQKALRNGLPDALDMLVLCLEGGISMTAAFQRVTDELLEVHPILHEELRIVQRETQLGLSIGEALKKMGERSGMEEVRDLASVLLQSERYGTSMVKALRMHADGWRHDRQQQMEMLAQQTAVKILFPTLLCIFPAIFIVLLGPAAFQMSNLFVK